MQAHHILRTLGLLGDLVHIERGGVGGDDGAGLGDLVELGEDLLLQRHVLEHGLDDQVVAAEVLQLDGRRQAAHALLGLRLGCAAALDVGFQRVPDAGDALVEGLLRGLDDGHRETGIQEREADARAHGAGTEDADGLDIAQLGIRTDARHVRRLPLGEECVLQRASVGARSRFAEQRALLGNTFGQRQGRRGLDSVDRGLRRDGSARMAADRTACLLEQAGCDLVDLLLADAARRLANLLACESHRRADHVAVDHLVDQSRSCALGRVDEGTRGDELQRLLGADGARETLRAAGTRNDAELDLGQAELTHVLARDAVVAAERQLQAAAQRRAVHGRDHRLGRLLDVVDQRRQVRLLHLAAEFGDVGAGGEEPARSRQHDRLDAGIGIGRVEGLLQAQGAVRGPAR